MIVKLVTKTMAELKREGLGDWFVLPSSALITKLTACRLGDRLFVIMHFGNAQDDRFHTTWIETEAIPQWMTEEIKKEEWIQQKRG